MSSPSPKHPFLVPVRHAIVLALEVMALVLALVILVVLLGVGRLMIGPMTTTALTPWIENLLSQPAYGIKAKITETVLDWDKERKRAVLDLSNILFEDALGQRVANVPQILIVLNPLGYFDEAHSPWSVAVRRPHMHARIDTQGRLLVGALSSGMKPEEMDQKDRKDEQPLSMSTVEAMLRDIVRSPRGQVAGLGFFANLTIEELGITIIDESKKITWNIRTPRLSLKRVKNDYEGKAGLIIQKADMETPLDFTLNYQAKTDDFTATWSFDHLNPALFAEHVAQLKVLDYIAAPLTGSLMVHFDEDLNVFDGAMNVNLDKGEIRLAELYPSPLAFAAGQAVARYDAKKKEVLVEPLRIDFDKDFSLSARANISVGKEPKNVNATFTLSDLAMDKVPHYWPESAGKNARDWILPHVKGGKVDRASVTIDLDVAQNDVTQATLKSVKGDVKVSGTQTTYWDPLPPAQKADAEATFTEKGFDIKVLRAEVGAIKVQPSPVTITGLDDVDQIITIEGHLTGPAQDMLAVIDRPPLGYAGKMNIKPADVGGHAEAVLKTSFPLLKALTFDQMTLEASADIKNASVKNVAGLFSVKDAEGHIDVNTRGLSFTAHTALNDVPAKVQWTEKFVADDGATLSEGKIRLQAFAQDSARFGMALPMSSKKPFPIDVLYQRQAKASSLKIAGELTGTDLSIPAVSFKKPEGQEAQFDMALDWGEGVPMRLSSLAARGKDLAIKGQGLFDAKQQLQSLSLNPLQLDATKVRLDYTRNEKGLPKISIMGSVLDLRDAFSGAGQQDKAAETEKTPLLLDVDVARVLTGSEAGLDDVKISGRRDAFGWAELNLSAKAVKGTPLSLVLGPKENRAALLFTTPDFGNVLRALDVTNTLDGGRLAIDGLSEPGDLTRTLFGHIKLEKFSVRDMPALAKLLSAISPDGLASLLSGSALGFEELTGEYVLNNDNIVITKASTSTGSLGLTTKGKYDLDKSFLQLEGQVIPVYFLSKILGAIPVIGDILTGGEGQGVFSATYRVEGPISKPAISVNPVSVLAPGILRTILFSDQNITRENKQDFPAPSKKP